MTLTSLVQITLPEDKHGCLTLSLVPQKSELKLKRLAKISSRIDVKSGLAVIFYGECKYPLTLALLSPSISINIAFSTEKVLNFSFLSYSHKLSPVYKFRTPNLIKSWTPETLPYNCARPHKNLIIIM